MSGRQSLLKLFTLSNSGELTPQRWLEMSLARTPQYSLQVENKLGLEQGWCARMLVISPIPGLEPAGGER
ncbi:hypothetical protein FOTG_14899 [Fusarium oxysporum f. sp. vasinfectum 25433]|uniref:Uncharacterized protein n=1 Tax=Fusarium oxysporum f. sp. vasinfectum 25433 TaxID=1089449 RepID=X0KTC4_FUSOX|nr:hypothetical protein FOTG_14899 [Fusarium oxysporum f. sp. vasinfectum 25433]